MAALATSIDKPSPFQVGYQPPHIRRYRVTPRGSATRYQIADSVSTQGLPSPNKELLPGATPVSLPVLPTIIIACPNLQRSPLNEERSRAGGRGEGSGAGAVSGSAGGGLIGSSLVRPADHPCYPGDPSGNSVCCPRNYHRLGQHAEIPIHLPCVTPQVHSETGGILGCPVPRGRGATRVPAAICFHTTSHLAGACALAAGGF